MQERVQDQTADPTMAKIVYVLYLVGLLNGVTILIGVVMAYIYADGAPAWLKTHYDLQIRTFWLGLLGAVVSGLLSLVLIGFLMFAVLVVWWIVRCIKGLKHLDERAAYPNHLTLLF